MSHQGTLKIFHVNDATALSEAARKESRERIISPIPRLCMQLIRLGARMNK